MSDTMEIEQADIPFIKDVLLLMQSECPFYSQFEADEKYADKVINSLIDNNDFAKIALGEDHNIAAIMLGAVSTIPFTKTKIATEIVIYVLPEYRGSTMAIDLISEFEHFAKVRGCAYSFVGVSSDIDKNKVSKMYQRLGYSERGINFMKEIT